MSGILQLGYKQLGISGGFHLLAVCVTKGQAYD